MKIAVVGAGLSGAVVVKSLLEDPNFNSNDEIIVFEPRDQLGVGLPYIASDDRSIRLNIGPEHLSVVESNPDDFVEWLDENVEEPTNFEDLVSRPDYGQYLLDRFEPYFANSQVTHVQTLVEDMEVFDTDEVASYVYRLKTEKGWRDEIYDAVFFAVGHPPYNDYYDLKGVENYIHHPYPMNEKLLGIDPEKRIGIVGSGATGIDLMRFFATNYDLKHPLTFYDPATPFNFVNIPYEKGVDAVPFTFSKEWIEAEKEKHDGFVPFEVMLNTFKADMAKGNVDSKVVYNTYKVNTLEIRREAMDSNDQSLALLQTYSSKLVPLLPHLFNALSGEDKAYYFEYYHAKLSFIKARVPYLSYKWLFELMDQGKVRAVAGLSEIEPQEDGTFLVHAEEDHEVDLLINASGFNMDLLSIRDNSSLINNLYHQEIILPHRNGKFILVDWPQSRVMNQRYGLMDNVFFFGLLIGGTQHENNDASLTIEQARYSAKQFMNQRT